MPQTLEHFSIVRTIGVKYAVAAITKADRCTEEELEQTETAVRELFKDSGLTLTSVVRTSVNDPESIDNLKIAVAECAVQVLPKTQNRCYVMRVDRVFNIKGHGTVVTGTSLFGKISTDNIVYNLRTGERARIKGIQVHDRFAEKSVAGQRTALNLPDFSTPDVRRGDIISENSKITSTGGIYAVLKAFEGCSDSELIRHNKTYPVLLGSEVFEGRVIFYDEKVLSASGEAICFIKLDKPALVFFNEPFVIRSASPQRSVAGGRVLGLEQTYPDRKASREIIEHMSRYDYDAAIRAIIRIYECGFYMNEPIQFSGLFRSELAEKLAQLNIVNYYGFLLDAGIIDGFVNRSLSTLKEKGVLPVNTLKLECTLPEQVRHDIVNRIIETAQKLGYVFDGHQLKVNFKDAFLDDSMMVLAAMKQEANLSNPALLAEKTGFSEEKVQKCLQYLCNRSFVKRADKNVYLSMELINSFVERAEAEAKKSGDIDINRMKECFDLPRKLLIPLMDQLDKSGLFINRSNKRMLKNK
jgi:selenocysteine-specific elongation factor